MIPDYVSYDIRLRVHSILTNTEVKKMKSKFTSLFLILFLSIVIIPDNSYSAKMKNAIKSGSYIPGDIVSIESLRFLPVPSTSNNYNIFQSIGNISNIIIGRFDAVPQRITLIQDTNADGKVDVAAHWLITDKKIQKEKDPGKFCSAEKFREYKESILKGNSSFEKIDTLNLFDYLLKDKTNIRRQKNGFRVVLADIDSRKRERIIYYFANNGINGYDLVLEVKYFKRNRSRINPLISHYAYCRGSRDSYVKEFVDRLLTKTNKALNR